jgi:hypothetical protein
MSASGQLLAIFLVFPKKNMTSDFLDGASAGSSGTCHTSGWMQAIIYAVVQAFYLCRQTDD